jgi:hypothetical protein
MLSYRLQIHCLHLEVELLIKKELKNKQNKLKKMQKKEEKEEKVNLKTL